MVSLPILALQDRWLDPNCLYLKPRTQGQTPIKQEQQSARKRGKVAHGFESDAAESAAESDSSWEDVQRPFPSNSNSPPRPMHKSSHQPQTPSDQPQTPQDHSQTPQDDPQISGVTSPTPKGQGTASQDQAKRFLAFSDGPRSCVGQPLAWINVTSTLAVLLAKFHFRLADKVRPTVQPVCRSLQLSVVEHNIAQYSHHDLFVSFAQ